MQANPEPCNLMDGRNAPVEFWPRVGSDRVLVAALSLREPAVGLLTHANLEQMLRALRLPGLHVRLWVVPRHSERREHVGLLCHSAMAKDACFSAALDLALQEFLQALEVLCGHL
jgi:hypothetical protein